MKDYKVYLLDFDGTLIDSEESLINVFLLSYFKVGLTVSKDQVRYLMRIPLSRGYKELNGPEDRFIEFRDEITRLLNSDDTLKLTKLYDDTLGFLSYLSSRNKAIGVVTGNNKKHFHDVLDMFSIPYDTFHVFIGNEESKVHKPNPEPILLALEKINYQGDLKDVCYIGDAEMDMIAATNAGVDGILIDRYNEYNSLPYVKIKSLKEIYK